MTPMQTRCPACATAFRISAEQLRLKSGKVRCGLCHKVFNAFDHLLDQPSLADIDIDADMDAELDAALAVTANKVPATPPIKSVPPLTAAPTLSTTAETVEKLDFSLEIPDLYATRTKLEIPPPTPLETPPKIAAPPSVPPQESSVAPDDWKAQYLKKLPVGELMRDVFDPALFAELKTKPSFISDPDDEKESDITALVTTASAAISERVRTHDEHLESDVADHSFITQDIPRPPASSTALPENTFQKPDNAESAVPTAFDDDTLWNEEEGNETTMSYWFFALFFLLLLLAQSFVYWRQDIVLIHPATREIYQTLNLSIPLPRQSELVTIEASDLQIDSTKGLHLLQASLRNRANFDQAWPVLELTLMDTFDAVLVRRIFLPADYLPASVNSDYFLHQSDVAIRLWLDAKEVNAAGYRLQFFYP